MYAFSTFQINTYKIPQISKPHPPNLPSRSKRINSDNYSSSKIVTDIARPLTVDPLRFKTHFWPLPNLRIMKLPLDFFDNGKRRWSIGCEKRLLAFMALAKNKKNMKKGKCGKI